MQARKRAELMIVRSGEPIMQEGSAAASVLR
jgi:hypothetical protein